MKIKIGSRGSKLALWQANYVMNILKEKFPAFEYEVVIIQTKGDKNQHVALSKMNDKGLFVKEIEEKLLSHEIHLAVHSMKDMPSDIPNGLVLMHCLKREDPKDVLILRENESSLKEKAVIGTGSIRRMAQMKKIRGDVIFKDIRGNVDTRLRKLDEGEYDALIMASAGLKRLSLDNRISHSFDYDEMVPACAQGALAVELRKDDAELIKMIEACKDDESNICVSAERKFLDELGGSCHIPIGACCHLENEEYHFDAIYGKDMDSIKEYHISGKEPDYLVEKALLFFRNEG
ncbi:MAG: hydroxymethylbilane synthase [Traorella sp.]